MVVFILTDGRVAAFAPTVRDAYTHIYIHPFQHQTNAKSQKPHLEVERQEGVLPLLELLLEPRRIRLGLGVLQLPVQRLDDRVQPVVVEGRDFLWSVAGPMYTHLNQGSQPL